MKDHNPPRSATRISIDSHVNAFQASLDVTGTFKYVKTKLVAEGFDPNRITDPLYFLDEKARDYVPLTQEIFNAVSSGKIKI